MGGCSSKAAGIIEIKAEDVLPDDEAHNNLLAKSAFRNGTAKFHVRLWEVHVRHLLLKESCYLQYDFGTDILVHTTEKSVKGDQNPSFNVNCEFEVDLGIDNLKSNCLKILVMEQKKDEVFEPCTTITIDFFTLVFGPSHHAIKLKRGSGTIGLLQYNINFEQVTQIQTKINEITLKINDVEDKPLCMNYKLICPDHKKESKKSNNEFGKYDNKKHETSLKFVFDKKNGNEQILSSQESLEKLVDSSLQILFWSDNYGITSKQIASSAISGKGINVNDIHLTEDSNQQSEDEEENDSEDNERNEDSEEPEDSNISEDESSKNESEQASAPNETDSRVTDSEDNETSDKHRYSLFGECHIGFLKIIEEAIKQNEKTGDTIIQLSTSGKKGKGKDLKQSVSIIAKSLVDK